MVSKRYGVQTARRRRRDEQIFLSLRRLTEYIAAHRTT